MKTNQSNIYNLKVGDVLRFTNAVGFNVVLTIKRVEEKSCYTNGRESWNTVNGYISRYNATIERS